MTDILTPEQVAEMRANAEAVDAARALSVNGYNLSIQRLEAVEYNAYTQHGRALVQRAAEDAATIERLTAQWREAIAALAACYRATGADPDGNDDEMLAQHAVAEVKTLREDSDAEIERLEAAVATLRAEKAQAEQERDEWRQPRDSGA